MRRSKFSIGMAVALGLSAATMFVVSTRAEGQVERVLHNFNGADGYHPYAGLIFDSSGNLYGTTLYGGPFNAGTVFELSPQANGEWIENVLYAFSPNGKEGNSPYAGLIFDAKGNLYGATSSGGSSYGGVAFKMTPRSGGGWTVEALHSFGQPYDGSIPDGTLVFDPAGNLYGTTFMGGLYAEGTVFELTPKTGGQWAERVLHTFDYNIRLDGYYPQAGLILDAAGNLYGTTRNGGSGGGTVFELLPSGVAGWKERTIHYFTFNGMDGFSPYAALISDSAGNLYGTTYFGGTISYGTVFEMMPTTGGVYTAKGLHSFNKGNDGSYPQASVTLDAAGNLYGTTIYGGNGTCSSGCGIVFKLTPETDGTWTEMIVHNFGNDGIDGTYPYAGLILDAAGNLYGTTSAGGAYGYGTVFEITP